MTEVKVGNLAYIRRAFWPITNQPGMVMMNIENWESCLHPFRDIFSGERMNKYLITIFIIIAALVLGVTAAFGVMGMIYNAPYNNIAIYQSNPGRIGPGMMGNAYNGRGMMGRNGPNTLQPSVKRISLDDAVQLAQDYAASTGLNLKAAEIMEFNNNFYVAVVEKDSGKAAFEVLVDPYSGSVFPEYGPNMMWNVKYGHMGSGSSQENTITFAQAQANAQEFLDTQAPGASVEPDGFTFYGYYTFDYKINDQIAGMLSVNGYNGQVWLHTWHGQFISEKTLSN